MFSTEIHYLLFAFISKVMFTSILFLAFACVKYGNAGVDTDISGRVVF